MQDEYESIERAFAAIGELTEGKFVTADTAITEILRRIAASKKLTELFTAVVSGYDYARARRTYLRFEEGAAHGVAYLPTGRAEILAFVFCLFVEFDAGSMRFGDFLLRYFYVDGSYTASYLVFLERMVVPFRDILRDCFPAPDKVQRAEALRKEEELFGAVAERIPAERLRVARFELREEERTNVERILTEMSAAAARQDGSELAALAAGYRYLLRYFGGEDGEALTLFALIAKI